MGVIQKKNRFYSLLLATLLILSNNGYADPPTLCTTDAEIQSKVLDYDRTNPAVFSKIREQGTVTHSVLRSKQQSPDPSQSGMFRYQFKIHYKQNTIESTELFARLAYKLNSKTSGRWSLFLDFLYLRDIAKKDLGQDIPW